MKRLLIVRPTAERHATDAFQWYEDKLPGLGDEFLLSLGACINSFSRNPEIYQKKYKNIRMALMERFPFGVCNLIDEDKIIVLAILHFSRKPKGIRKLK